MCHVTCLCDIITVSPWAVIVASVGEGSCGAGVGYESIGAWVGR